MFYGSRSPKIIKEEIKRLLNELDNYKDPFDIQKIDDIVFHLTLELKLFHDNRIWDSRWFEEE